MFELIVFVLIGLVIGAMIYRYIRLSKITEANYEKYRDCDLVVENSNTGEQHIMKFDTKKRVVLMDGYPYFSFIKSSNCKFAGWRFENIPNHIDLCPQELDTPSILEMRAKEGWIIYRIVKKKK